MKKFIVLLISIFSVVYGMAQKWWYSVESQVAGTIITYDYMILEAGGDTLINGITCTKLKKSQLTCADHEYTSYIYYDGAKIFWFNEIINNFVLIYDFSASMGDSINIVSTWDNSDTCNNYYKIRSIDSVSLNNRKLPLFNEEILGIVGHLNKYFLPERCSSKNGIVEDCFNNRIISLRCYEDNVLGHFRRWDSIPCDTVYTIQTTHVYYPERNIEAVDLYPNPSSSSINIRVEHDEIQQISIYNLHGQIQQTNSYSSHPKEVQVGLADFLSGVYFLHLQLSNGRNYVKRIIKQ